MHDKTSKEKSVKIDFTKLKVCSDCAQWCKTGLKSGQQKVIRCQNMLLVQIWQYAKRIKTCNVFH